MGLALDSGLTRLLRWWAAQAALARLFQEGGVMRAATAIAVACGLSLATVGCSDDEAQKHKTLALGFVGQFSNTHRIAFLTACLRSINDAGGIEMPDGTYELELAAEDHGGSTEGGVQAMERLADQGVSTVIDPNWSSIILGEQPDHSDGAVSVAKERRMLVVSGGATSPAITDLDDDDLIWRTVPSDSVQGTVAADALIEQGVTTAAVIHRDDAYGNGLADAFEQAFQGKGGQITSSVKYETDGADQLDFKAQLEATFAPQPRAILLVSFEEVYAITSQIDVGGYLDAYADAAPIFFGTDGFFAPDTMLENIPASVLRHLQGTVPKSDSKADDYQKLVELMRAEGIADSDNVDGARFDAVELLALSIQAAQSRSADDIKLKLGEISRADAGDTVVHAGEWAKAKAALLAGEGINYEGASGPIEFSDQGDPTAGSIGRWQIIEKSGVFSIEDDVIVPYQL
jgi:ABC-type branched-subunit amino acid transport system substrate-binding protein